MSEQIFDVIIIGAGRAGLAVAAQAQRQGLNYLVLEGSQHIGDSWRQRYDSLVLFTPRRYSQFPDMPMPGEPEGYPNKDEMAGYLGMYAKANRLRVQLGEPATEVTKHADMFIVRSAKASYRARNVVLATGPFQVPFIPAWASRLPPEVMQVHSSEYHNSRQIKGHKVLVVGGRNSGAQIAVELLRAGHDVSLATKHKIHYLPPRILGKSVFWWLYLLVAMSHRFGRGRAFTGQGWWVKTGDTGTRVMGIRIKKLARQKKLQLYPAAQAAEDKIIVFADGRRDNFETVIWATGFTFDYSWVKLPGVVTAGGEPNHHHGVCRDCPGLFFIGLVHQRAVPPLLLPSVCEDAVFILDNLL
jgi:putative flavoprotein involved in K+ transport